jgi:hypothetical protein
VIPAPPLPLPVRRRHRRAILLHPAGPRLDRAVLHRAGQQVAAVIAASSPPGRTDPHRSVLPAPRSCRQLACPSGSGGRHHSVGGQRSSSAIQKNAAAAWALLRGCPHPPPTHRHRDSPHHQGRGQGSAAAPAARARGAPAPRDLPVDPCRPSGCHPGPSAVKGRCALMSARSAFGRPLTAPGPGRRGAKVSPGWG